MAGAFWRQMHAQPRRAAADLHRDQIPKAPGVYAWYRDGEAIYDGRALGRNGLWERIGKNHLSTSHDLSRSSFRRDVCEHLGIAPTTITARRPAVLSSEDVQPINDWIRRCEIAWIVCESADEAEQLEKALLAEWMPPLSRR